MLRIGLIGEYPTDIECISLLLRKKYADKVSFFPLIYDVHGSNLENQKIKHQLRREFQIEKPDFVLFIRDLDGLEDAISLIEKRQAYFIEYNSVINKKGLLLLNVYELEALLLSDIEKLEKFYEVAIGKIEDCMKIVDPKGYLNSKIRKYTTGDNVTLFALLDYDQVVSNCRYFKKFIEQFHDLLFKSAA